MERKTKGFLEQYETSLSDVEIEVRLIFPGRGGWLQGCKSHDSKLGFGSYKLLKQNFSCIYFLEVLWFNSPLAHCAGSQSSSEAVLRVPE